MERLVEVDKDKYKDFMQLCYSEKLSAQMPVS